LLAGRAASEAEAMSNADDIRQPQDHLPKKEDRDPAADVEQAHYPGTEAPAGESSASPDTAAEPDEPARHGVAKLPTTDR
jgi:hypothetical protein